MQEPSDPGHACDLLVVGGGIHGAGIARDAAGRGLSVLLCEQHDLAAHTSSSSTKLIHGGLRYLEHGEFALVRKALQERSILMRAAPHIIRPLRFVMPQLSKLRPASMIRLGLFLYDHLARHEMLAPSRHVDLRRHVAGVPLRASMRNGFVYSDGWVDDARLVVLTALDASERGARIRTRTRLVGAERHGDVWLARLAQPDGAQAQVRARALVNASGPWVDAVLKQLRCGSASGARARIRLVKGSHIVTRRLFDHDHAYLFQNPDRRIIFAIPYEQDFTLIGTTDIEYHGDPAAVAIEAAEIDYLCASINRYFRQGIGAADLCWSYSGVRPLFDDARVADPEALTRDYRLELDPEEGAVLLTVVGGKITTYRKLAEQALDILCRALGERRAPWTADVPLPGGDIPNADFGAFAADFAQRHRWLDPALAQRYASTYGTRAEQVLAGARSPDGLGRDVAAGLHEAELRYLRDVEWARCAEDVLWRRSKRGLHIAPEARAVAGAAIDAWFAGAGTRS